MALDATGTSLDVQKTRPCLGVSRLLILNLPALQAIFVYICLAMKFKEQVSSVEVPGGVEF